MPFVTGEIDAGENLRNRPFLETVVRGVIEIEIGRIVIQIVPVRTVVERGERAVVRIDVADVTELRIKSDVVIFGVGVLVGRKTAGRDVEEHV